MCSPMDVCISLGIDMKAACARMLASCVPSAVVASLLVLTATASRAEPPPPGPLDACQLALAGASRKLGDRIRRHVRTCIVAGLHCLSDAGTEARCCATAAPRCEAEDARLLRAEQRFALRVRAGRCAVIPFPNILEPAGLGFATAADACHCFATPTDVIDHHSLGVCLAQLVDSQTTRLLALAETPRAAEALACVGLDRVIDTLASSDAVAACARPVATASASQRTPTSRPTPSTRPSVTAAPVETPATTRTPSGRPSPTHTPLRQTTPVPTTATATRSPSGVASPTGTPIPSRTAVPTRTRTPVPAPSPTPICGNGIVEGDEQCDGKAFDTSACVGDVCTCEDFCDDAGGVLSCRRDCTIDFSRCTAGGCEF